MRNAFRTSLCDLLGIEYPILQSGMLVQHLAAQDIFAEGNRRQDGEYIPMATGQGVGLIHDLPGAGDVVHAIVREACAVMAALPRRARVT